MNDRDHDHDEIRSLLGAYVLGSLPAEELATVRSHTMTCDSCMREADELTETVASLGMTVGELPTPAGFAERILSQVSSQAEVPETSLRLAARRRAPWNLVAAAAIVALSVATAGFAWAFIGERDAVGDRDATFAAIVDSHAGLGLKSRGGDLVGRVFPTDLGALFIAQGLNDLPTNKTYQLWFMRLCSDGSTPCGIVSAGTFESKGSIAFLRTSRSPAHFDAAAVTIEPAGGSEQPTTTPLITSAG
ncbi:MAG: anti-sigma factor [Actinomycetota bacterium]|nr:anti-sigma factor [Actinomycetota bacterium]